MKILRKVSMALLAILGPYHDVGSPSGRASVSEPTDEGAHSNRVSTNQSLRCRETEFSGQRQRGRNGHEGSRTPVQRQNLASQPRQFGANRRERGNLR